MAGEVLSKNERDDLRNMGGILTVYSLQKLFDTCDALELRAEAAEREVEQLRVQLAGCSIAALGGTKDPATQGQYGWSVAYQDVLELRRDRDVLVAAMRDCFDDFIAEWENKNRRSNGRYPVSFPIEAFANHCGISPDNTEILTRLNIAADAKEQT